MKVLIVGKPACGKTSLVKEMCNRLYNSTVAYTTRPMREGEKNGKDYFFISEDKFKQKKLEGFFAETSEYNTKFGIWYYGSSRESYKEDGYMASNPEAVKQIRNEGIECIVVKLECSDETAQKRYVERGGDIAEFRRRLKTDADAIAGCHWDLCYNTDVLSTNALANFIEQDVQMFKNVMFRKIR